MWALAGNVFYGASQWAILSLIAKLGNREMLGQYALAVAVAAPVARLSHLNLRAVLATDAGRRRPFGDYFAVRLGTGALALVVIVAIAALSGYPHPVVSLIVLAGLSLSLENVSDIYYGALQRRERMDQIARSMIAFGLISVVALGLVLRLTGDLVAAAASIVVARAAVLLAYDRRRGLEGERPGRSGRQTQIEIFRTALPLGVVLMLVSLTANIPRYAIEYHLGTPELGAFAAVVTFLTAGAAVVGALGQSAMPRLARHFSSGDLAGFRWLALRMAGLAIALGLAGVLIAVLFGEALLAAVYRPEYAAFGGLLVAIMTAGVFSYAAIALGYAITSARVFRPQVPLLAAVAATCAILSWLLVPTMGLSGAALAIALSACLQIGGEVFILRRAAARVETAA